MTSEEKLKNIIELIDYKEIACCSNCDWVSRSSDGHYCKRFDIKTILGTVCNHHSGNQLWEAKDRFVYVNTLPSSKGIPHHLISEANLIDHVSDKVNPVTGQIQPFTPYQIVAWKQRKKDE